MLKLVVGRSGVGEFLNIEFICSVFSGRLFCGVCVILNEFWHFSHINEVHFQSWAGQELMANQMDQLYADGRGLTQHSFLNQAPDAEQTRADELRLEWIQRMQ